jgi:hypothetical protein
MLTRGFRLWRPLVDEVDVRGGTHAHTAYLYVFLAYFEYPRLERRAIFFLFFLCEKKMLFINGS